eukprot:7090553-Pyramimonas_sp.AAC.1
MAEAAAWLGATGSASALVTLRSRAIWAAGSSPCAPSRGRPGAETSNSHVASTPPRTWASASS